MVYVPLALKLTTACRFEYPLMNLPLVSKALDVAFVSLRVTEETVAFSMDESTCTVNVDDDVPICVLPLYVVQAI